MRPSVAGDPLIDVAFLVMELVANDYRELAGVLRNAYVSAAGDFHSSRLLHFYLAYRAMVRGKVNGVKATEIEITGPDRGASSRAGANPLAGRSRCPGSSR